MTDAVVATGIGVIAPNGLTTEEFWQNTLAGKTGIDRITRFDPAGYEVTIAGEIRDFDPIEHMPGLLIAQTDRMTQFALAATGEALRDAHADPADLPEFGMAVITANSAGGAEFGQRELEKLQRSGPQHVGAYMSIAWFYAANTGQISIRHKMRGPCVMVAAEQAGGLDAIGHARRMIRRGTQFAVTGGTDAPFSPAGLIAQMTTKRLSRSTDPMTAYRPFSATAEGYIAGEGGAMIICENASDARARGVTRVYGEIAGYAATFDPPPGSPRPPGLRRALELALDDAGLAAADVDLVLADGHGTRELDRREAAAIAGVFGPNGVPVSVPKTLTGRMYSGGSATDVATALLAIRDQIAPPTGGPGDVAADCPIDLVAGAPRELAVRNVVVLSRGYGGLSSSTTCFNAAAVVRAVR
jgi:minimal PKS chain-length factor (CLF/KS beta)